MATPDEDDALRRRIELSIEHVVVLIDRCDGIPPANVNYEIKMSLQSSLESIRSVRQPSDKLNELKGKILEMIQATQQTGGSSQGPRIIGFAAERANEGTVKSLI